MTSDTPTRMIVVKKEEKEPRLRQLIAQAIEAARYVETPMTLRVVALSLSSPVARAVAVLQTELAAAGISARLILAKTDHGPDSATAIAGTWRHLADVRCHDSHELLVLGTETTWIGDCLRRDPANRDSFELHSSSNRETALLFAQSFDKLWQLSHVYEPRDVAGLDLIAGLSVLAPDSLPQALTRH